MFASSFLNPGGVDIKFNSVQPAAIDATTNFVTVTGAIRNYDGMAGCVASFRMGFTRH